MKKSKEKNWIKRGNNAFVTSIWALILIVVTIAYFEYYSYNKHFDRIEQNYTKSETNKKLNAVLKKLTQTQDSIQHKEKLPYFELQKDFLDVKSEVSSLKSEVKAEKKSFFRIFSSFWGIMGSILGLIAVFFAYKEFMQKAVIKEIAKITGKSIEQIQQNFDQYRKHVNLKKDSKILILNEKDTQFPDGFNQVLKLFNVGKKDRLDIEGLEDALTEENIKKMRKADLIIIENQVSTDNKKWNIKKKYTRDIEDKVESEKIKLQNEIADKNLKNLENIANQICDTTSLIYYGLSNDGFFPADKVDPKKQHFVSFANAPSQLYGNMLNMLKFKNELENAN